MKKFLLEIDDDGKATIREIKVGIVHIQEEGPGIIYPKYEPVNNPIPIKQEEKPKIDELDEILTLNYLTLKEKINQLIQALKKVGVIE